MLSIVFAWLTCDLTMLIFSSVSTSNTISLLSHLQTSIRDLQSNFTTQASELEELRALLVQSRNRITKLENNLFFRPPGSAADSETDVDDTSDVRIDPL